MSIRDISGNELIDMAQNQWQELRAYIEGLENEIAALRAALSLAQDDLDDANAECQIIKDANATLCTQLGEWMPVEEGIVPCPAGLDCRIEIAGATLLIGSASGEYRADAIMPDGYAFCRRTTPDSPD
jgi:outer membrane murein-binding lipoprotein Lpp